MGGDVLLGLLDGLEMVELYSLRQAIDSRLPARTLSSVDLVEELLLQYQIAKALMAATMNNAGVPANQKAQVQNSCVATLKQVADTQMALLDAERVKAIEQAVERAMLGVPMNVKEAFIERYTALLAEEVARKRGRRSP